MRDSVDLEVGSGEEKITSVHKKYNNRLLSIPQNQQ